ncbi:DUF4189 domain-containing protein [Roseibium sp. M-1]
MAGCKDNSVFEDLLRDANSGDPIAAFWVFRNMKLKKCVRHNKNPHNWNAYLEKSAQAGFPRSIWIAGKYYLYGYGPKQDIRKGEKYLKEAAALGSALAASDLAYAYLKGNVLRRHANNGFKYLDQAIKGGLSEKDLNTVLNIVPSNLQDQAKRVVAEAKAAPEADRGRQENVAATKRNQAQSTQQSSSASSNSTEKQQPKFAALAVSNEDGTYGWSFDYSSRQGAEQNALDECSRHSSSCNVKLVLKGPACIAYHYQKGQSVYGWGFSKDSGTAQQRAAGECSKRNGGQNCGAHVWSCNARTNEPVEVLHEASLPPVVTAGAGVDCDFHVSFECKIPGNTAKTKFAYESFRVGKKLRVPGIESCKAFRKDGSLIYREFGGDTFRRPGIFEAHANRLSSLVKNLKAEVSRRFPGCSDSYVEIAVNNQGKSSFNSKPARMNFDNGTPRYSYINLE